MKILHVNLVYEPADTAEALVARYATLSTLAARQAAAGASVTVAQRFARDESFTHDGVRYEMRRDGVGHPRGRAWTFAPRLTALACEQSPDVIHLHGLMFGVQARALRTALGRRTAVVVQDHGIKPWGVRRLPGMRKALLSSIDGVLLNAIEMADPLRRAGILPAVLPAYEVREASSDFQPAVRADARARLGLNGDPLVLWVGRLQSIKDPHTAVEGFCRMARRSATARLAMIYQSSDELGALRAIVASHGLDARVTFQGAVTHGHLRDYYSAADLFVTASRWEGSNYALIEAMACGLWPVCSDNPSHRGMVGDVGRPFAVGDLDACERALDHAALAVSSNRRGCAAKVRARFEQSLSWDAIVRQSMAAYQHVLANRRARHQVAHDATPPRDAAFDTLASAYDSAFTSTELGRRHRRAVWRRLDDRFVAGMRVLDLGCGTGEDACYLAERGVSVVATDASSAMVEQAARKLALRRLAGSVATLHCPIETISDALGTFDGVMSNFGAINCVSLESTAKALKASVRKGGFAVLVVMGPRSIWEWFWFLSRAQPGAAFRRARGAANWRGMTVTYPTPHALESSLAPDFVLRRVSGVGTLLPPSFADSFANRHPALVDRLERIERASETAWPIAGFADHYVAEFERVTPP